MGTSEDRVAEACARRAQGASLRQIARDLGVASSTVLRWTNPAWLERDRAFSREAKRARRAPCERCSRPLSYSRVEGLCRWCVGDDARVRRERIATLYAEGCDCAQIAVLLDCSQYHVRNSLARLQRAGALTLRYPPRDPPTVRKRDREILALHDQGLGLDEIARRVGLTEGSVNQVLVRLRARDALAA